MKLYFIQVSWTDAGKLIRSTVEFDVEEKPQTYRVKSRTGQMHDFVYVSNTIHKDQLLSVYKPETFCTEEQLPQAWELCERKALQNFRKAERNHYAHANAMEELIAKYPDIV